MASIEISVDLGSKFITIYQKGIGLVLREPAIAIATKNRNKFEIREAGYRAESIMNGSLGGAKIISPIKEGVIVDEEMATMLLQNFLARIMPESLIKPRVKAIVSICSSSLNSDRRVVEKCCLKAGMSEVTLVESPLSLLAYTGSIGGLFVDIGGGKTEIAAVTNHGIATGCSVNIAGDAFNNAIIDDFYLNYGIKIGDFTMEKLKKSALSFYLNDEGSYAVSGGGKDGAPRSLFVTAEAMRNAVIPLVDDLIEVIMSVLHQTPPELSAEILRKGIFITGGSLHIPGIVDYIEQALELPVTPLEDIENAVAIGGAKFFDNRDLLSDMLGVKLA
ncbi:MAG: rod shape-determining protein [Clostridia bacterium]|nr:rod shape-determining protein [Clostridia bacterium]